MKSSIRFLKEPAFSLVEVTITLGLLSFVLVALLGLFSVGITTSREAGVETMITQIAWHVRSSYDGEVGTKTLMYSYEGELLSAGEEDGFFEVELESKESDMASIEYTSDHLHLLTLRVTSPRDATLEKTIHSSVFVP